MKSGKLKIANKNIINVIHNLRKEFKKDNLDIEFAVDSKYKLYILQVRLINNAPRAKKKLIFDTYLFLDRKLKY